MTKEKSFYVGISATAHYLPGLVKSSADIENQINLNLKPKVKNGSIERLTGIIKRHVSTPTEYNSTLAIEACKILFEKEGVNPKEIDLLIFASAGKDLLEPATSHIVQAEIGTSCPVLDVSNACNSFINAIEIAVSFVELGKYKSVLIATGEVPSKTARYDLESRHLLRQYLPGFTFGDAGTAVIVDKKAKIASIVDSFFFSESDNWDAAMFPGGGSRFVDKLNAHFFLGDPNKLMVPFFTHTKRILTEFLKNNGMEVCDIDHFFVHQVAEVYLDKMSKNLKIPMSKIEVTIKEYGNMASASMPLAFDLCLKSKHPTPGSKGIFIGLAGGISIGLVLINFN